MDIHSLWEMNFTSSSSSQEKIPKGWTTVGAERQILGALALLCMLHIPPFFHLL